MAEAPENLILHYLRRIDEKVDKLTLDMREVKERLGFLVRQYASLSRPLDTVDERVARIERRLELIPAGGPAA